MNESINYATIIGSRDTPRETLAIMSDIATYFCKLGVVVRSGKAGGADMAASLGCLRAQAHGNLNSTPEMYIPWRGFSSDLGDTSWDILFGDNTQASLIAESIHPAWERCTQGVKKLHTRNVGQILGKDLMTPSDLVLYWCKEDKQGNPTGGTATAVNLAKSYGIDIVNMVQGNDWKIACRKLIDGGE